MASRPLLRRGGARSALCIHLARETRALRFVRRLRRLEVGAQQQRSLSCSPELRLESVANSRAFLRRARVRRRARRRGALQLVGARCREARVALRLARCALRVRAQRRSVRCAHRLLRLRRRDEAQLGGAQLSHQITAPRGEGKQAERVSTGAAQRRRVRAERTCLQGRRTGGVHSPFGRGAARHGALLRSALLRSDAHRSRRLCLDARFKRGESLRRRGLRRDRRFARTLRSRGRASKLGALFSHTGALDVARAVTLRGGHLRAPSRRGRGRRHLHVRLRLSAPQRLAVRLGDARDALRGGRRRYLKRRDARALRALALVALCRVRGARFARRAVRALCRAERLLGAAAFPYRSVSSLSPSLMLCLLFSIMET